jgi:transcription antitermination factor NusG
MQPKWQWESMSGSFACAKIADDANGSRTQSSHAGHSQQWFAVEIRHRFEKRVHAHLVHQGVQIFLPLLTEHHTWSDRQKAVTVPLFPGYAFVLLDQSRRSWQTVMQTAGLIRFVSFAGQIVSVPAKQIEDLQLLLQHKGRFSLDSFVHPGQKVRVRGGCLNGLEGTLLQHENKKLVISIQSVQRSVVVEIDGYELELA